MIYLTDSAVQYAANICSELAGYKVSIACSREKANKLIEKLLLIIDSNNITKKYSDTLYFKNGSLIRFVPFSESTIGVRAHLLIVDHKVKDEFLHQVLLPMETMDWYKMNEISSEEE